MGKSLVDYTQDEEKKLSEQRIVSLRNEVDLLRRKNDQLLAESEAQDRIVKYVQTMLGALPPGPVAKKIASPKGQKIVESAVLLWSCFHIGETVSKEEMGGLNEYNFDVFMKRYQYIIDKTISFTVDNMKSHTFDTLHIIATGDMVSGIIHDELIQTNDLTIVEQAVSRGPFVVAQGIRDLAQFFPNIVVTCVVGNHGRVTQKKYFKHKQTVSWDYVFYQTLASLLRNQSNVTFNIPESFWAGLEVNGWNFNISHGDTIKSWGGIPFYGLQREVSKWTEIAASQDMKFQYYVRSHFHNSGKLQTAVGENILNASLKGGDEYAMGLPAFSDPIQLLFGVHEKYGKSWSLDINAKHASDQVRFHDGSGLNLAEQGQLLDKKK